MLSLFFDYTTWHYTHALVVVLQLTRDFVRFFLNLFSVKLSLQNLFRPVFSIPVDGAESTYGGDVVATFLGGMLVRLLGAFFRTLLILLGVFTSILTVLFFMIVSILWIGMPALLCATAYYLVSLSYIAP